jgi:hypothetical protein
MGLPAIIWAGFAGHQSSRNSFAMRVLVRLRLWPLGGTPGGVWVSKKGHGSILCGSLKRSLGMAKLAKRCNHPQILRI